MALMCQPPTVMVTADVGIFAAEKIHVPSSDRPGSDRKKGAEAAIAGLT